jgi:hypothetical protein
MIAHLADEPQDAGCLEDVDLLPLVHPLDVVPFLIIAGGV